MTATLRTLSEEGGETGLPATFEATHHGPELEQPAFFVEIGYATETAPPLPAVRLLARVLPRLSSHEVDRVAMAAGGGHYAPHFTELALRRHWAFGHILSRHALETIDGPTAAAALQATPGAEGILFSRAEDAQQPIWRATGSRLRDAEAPERHAR
jgi:D-aminoacyl-tRNA deacylase